MLEYSIKSLIDIAVIAGELIRGAGARVASAGRTIVARVQRADRCRWAMVLLLSLLIVPGCLPGSQKPTVFDGSDAAGGMDATTDLLGDSVDALADLLVDAVDADQDHPSDTVGADQPLADGASNTDVAPDTELADAPDTELADATDTELADAPDTELADATDTELADATETANGVDLSDAGDAEVSDQTQSPDAGDSTEVAETQPTPQGWGNYILPQGYPGQSCLPNDSCYPGGLCLNGDCVADTDGDGIPDDGDGSGTIGDNPCDGTDQSGCDDNCPYLANGDQLDDDHNGVGNACQASCVFRPAVFVDSFNDLDNWWGFGNSLKQLVQGSLGLGVIDEPSGLVINGASNVQSGLISHRRFDLSRGFRLFFFAKNNWAANTRLGVGFTTGWDSPGLNYVRPVYYQLDDGSQSLFINGQSHPQAPAFAGSNWYHALLRVTASGVLTFTVINPTTLLGDVALSVTGQLNVSQLTQVRLIITGASLTGDVRVDTLSLWLGEEDGCNYDVDGDGLPEDPNLPLCESFHITRCRDNCPNQWNPDQKDTSPPFGVGDKCQ